MLDMNSKKKTAWTLRAARATDLPAIYAVLTSCELTTGGVTEETVDHYVVAEHNGAIVGAAGVELHGPHGLLRSVGVAPESRGSGLGWELVRERLEWTRSRGVESIYLLTMTAERYFAERGFAAVPREQAPAEIQVSDEFTQLCPSSAALMRYTGETSDLA